MKRPDSGKMKIYCRITFLLLLALFLTSCISWFMEKPTFALRGISLQPLSFTEMSLLFNLEVQNPNTLNFTLKSFDYTIYLNNEEIGNGRLEKELFLPAKSTISLQAPVKAKFKNLNQSVKAFLTEDNLPYKIEGKAEITTVLGSFKFPFVENGRINLKN